MTNSLYTQTGEFHLDNYEVNKNNTWDEAEPSIGKFGLNILCGLLRYRILNKPNIEKYIQIKHKNSWKVTNLDATIKKLINSGLVVSYSIKDNEADILIVYCLSTDGIEYLNEINISNTTMPNGIEMIKDTSDALKWLSLNQYHIGILSQLKNKVIEQSYNQFVADTTDLKRIVPSYVRYPLKRKKEEQTTIIINLFAWMAPRNGDNINTFLEDILRAHQFVVEYRKYKNAIFLIICQSEKTAESLAHQMVFIRQMRPIEDILFTIDEITNRENFLETIYRYELTNDKLVHSAIDIS